MKVRSEILNGDGIFAENLTRALLELVLRYCTLLNILENHLIVICENELRFTASGAKSEFF